MRRLSISLLNKIENDINQCRNGMGGSRLIRDFGPWLVLRFQA
jgi:hypothetical protein